MQRPCLGDGCEGDVDIVVSTHVLGIQSLLLISLLRFRNPPDVVDIDRKGIGVVELSEDEDLDMYFISLHMVHVYQKSIP